MAYVTKEWILKHPVGSAPEISNAAELRTLSLSASDLKDGELFVNVLYISNDPGQLIGMGESIENPALVERFQAVLTTPGEKIKGGGIVEVLESKNENYRKGDRVQAMVGWCDYAIIPAAAVMAPVAYDPVEFLAMGERYGVITSQALAAYMGLFKVAGATSNDSTIVVSGAAGATGSIVCQIAKNVIEIKNVIGIAGSDEKCKLLTSELGCDVALNYKSPNFEADFEKATEGLVDVYFDNVGGHITELTLKRMKLSGRVAVCGAMSAVGKGSDVTTVSNSTWANIIYRSLKIIGFTVFDYMEDAPQATGELMGWINEGKVRTLKTVWEMPIEELPTALLKVFNGENVGKAMTRLT